MYLFMELVPFEKRYVLLICRFIVGAGSGNVALLRSYASTASHRSDRSRAIAFVTCGQAVGQTLGPVFQLMFTPFKYPGPELLGFFHLNIYTLPAYLACFINIFGIFALYRMFEEKYVDLVDEELDEQNPENEELESPPCNQIKNILPMYDRVAVLICFATRFMDMYSR
jgi:MFS family permease